MLPWTGHAGQERRVWHNGAAWPGRTVRQIVVAVEVQRVAAQRWADLLASVGHDEARGHVAEHDPHRHARLETRTVDKTAKRARGAP